MGCPLVFHSPPPPRRPRTLSSGFHSGGNGAPAAVAPLEEFSVSRTRRRRLVAERGFCCGRSPHWRGGGGTSRLWTGVVKIRGLSGVGNPNSRSPFRVKNCASKWTNTEVIFVPSQHLCRFDGASVGLCDIFLISIFFNSCSIMCEIQYHTV